MAVHRNHLDAQSARSEISSYVHADYSYYHPEWTQIRDAIAGERRVKEKGHAYLPPLDAEYGTTYHAYKERAIFVNMVSRTVLGLVGTIFRRPLKTENIDKKNVQNVTLDGLDLNGFAKKLAYEVCSVGRVGILVDMDKSENPYLTEYVAENILSWRTETINGRKVLTYVLLREIVDDTPLLGVLSSPMVNSNVITSGLSARYRVLILEDGVYKQRVFKESQNTLTGTALNTDFVEIIPTRNGTTFDFIPMVIIGAMAATPEVQKSPVYDITTLNFSHYRTSAQLEHGRYYTALPVYFVQVTPGQEAADYHVGPSVVWEVAPDSKPGILEYFGTGLKSLADSMTEKEEHIAQLGGRIMGIRPAATSESDNIYKMKQANEMSILLNITESLSSALTQAMTWYLSWKRIPSKDVRVKLNQEFKSLQIAARELRAVALLYQSGIIPIQSVYETLQTAEFISEEVTMEEFIEMLSNMDNFPNQPDVVARNEGYPDARSKQTEGMTEEQREAQEIQAQLDREHALLLEGRREDQQLDLQSEMFEQGLKTTRFEHALEKDMESHKSKLKVKEAKAAPKPAAKSGAVKPAPKKKKV